MSFLPLELKTLTEEDLAALLEAMRLLATTTKNRVALDLYAVIEREMLARYQPIEIDDYRDDEIAKAATTLARAVDAGRAHGLSDDHPPMKFLLLTITVLIKEMGRREMLKQLQ